MRFRILGPLEVSVGDQRLDLGVRAQRAVLALLLLQPRQVVSVDEIVDELWPSEPPPTAVKTVQAHVSRLRKVLEQDGHERLERRGHGYVLHFADDELDAERFRLSAEAGRRALAAGDAATAASLLREALEQWRGAPLADLARDGFARTQIARLEEQRLTTLEERVAADLALGRHVEVVAELEELVARHPLRERLREQLMLALYRSGRQAAALAAYQDARRLLVGELGLEPGQGLRRLERQILEQDPSLDPSRPVEKPAKASAAPVRGRRLAIVAGVLAATAVAAAAVSVLLGNDDTDAGAAKAEEVPGAVVLDASSGEMRASIPLGTAPAQVAVGPDSVWVLDADDQTITQIDRGRNVRLRTFAVAAVPTDLATGAGAVWVGNASKRPGFADTNFPVSISRLDAESGVVERIIRLPNARKEQRYQGGGDTQQHIAVAPDAVWAVDPDGSVSRIDPRTAHLVAVIRGLQAKSIAIGDAGVWVISGTDVARIDPRKNAVARRIHVGAQSATALTVGAGVLWVADPLGGSVWRVDPAGQAQLRQIPLALGVRALAFGAGRVWVTNEITGSVDAIEPRTGVVKHVRRLPAPQHIAIASDTVWVSDRGAPSGEERLSPSVCGRVQFRENESPRLLIVSDLPLQGPVRRLTAPMVAGIRSVLEQHGFRAGRHDVGYQSCDDATAQAGGSDIYRCFANARAYARAPEVIGVIGAFLSFCSSFEIPVANQAPDGPLAMISPSNTYTGLTRRYPGSAQDELAHLYPVGARNFVRIAAADHLAAVALATAARSVGSRRVFVSWDGADPYSSGAATQIRAAARRLGLRVVGSAGWPTNAQRYGVFARQVAADRPEAVVLFGAAPPGTASLLKALRSHLGRRVALIGSDGFADFRALRAQAGSLANGLYVVNYGRPNARLPAAGRRLLRVVRQDRGSSGPDFTAAYGAAAAQVLLHAIARSDGTRASVTRELRRTRIDAGVIGAISFDAEGDLVEAPFTVYRVTPRGPVVDRVLTVR